MKVPLLHYGRFWALKSALGIGTGFALAYMSFLFLGFFLAVTSYSIYILLISPTIFFLFLIHSQIFVGRAFWGKNRGLFEFSYFEFKFKRNAKEIITCVLTKPRIADRHPSFLSKIINNPESYSKKLNDCKVEFRDIQFIHQLFRVKAAIREKEYDKAIGILNEAKSYKPNDLILNFLFGRVSEYINERDSAIISYSIGSKYAKNISNSISEYFNNEKNRVDQKGCKSEPKLLGFMYGTF